MCIRVLRMSSQTTSSTPKKAAKREKSRNQAVLPIFVGYAFDLLLFARKYLDSSALYICREFVHYTVWQSSTERGTIAFGTLHPKSLLLSSENYRFSNQQKYLVLC